MITSLERATRTQNALWAFSNGFNVQPVGHNSKTPIKGTPSKQLDHMRLCWTESEVHRIFDGFDCNIGIKLGETSLNAFVVDIDDPELAQKALVQLTKLGIHTTVIKSANRGYHIYFRCTDCAIAGSKFSSGDIKGQGGLVVFAGSSIDGNFYEFVDASIPHADTRANLTALISIILNETLNLFPTTYGRNTWVAQIAGTVTHRVGRWLATYTEYIEKPTPTGNRNDRLYKNTHYAIATGRPLSEVENAARRDGLPESEIAATVASAQHAHIAPDRAIGGQTWHWSAAQRFADNYNQWTKGVAGNTERQVFAALVERCRVDGNDHGVFRASYRELSTLAQISKLLSVNKAIKRLVAQGLLIQVSGKRQKQVDSVVGSVEPPPNGATSAPIDPRSLSDKLTASHWQFSEKVVARGTQYEPLVQKDCVSTVYQLQHAAYITFTRDKQHAELLERGSLGQTAIRVYSYLVANNGTPSQAIIARALNTDRATVSRALKKLASDDYKLAEYVEDDKRWYARPMTADQWAELAYRDVVVKGVNHYEQRKERYAQERHENLFSIFMLMLEKHQQFVEWKYPPPNVSQDTGEIFDLPIAVGQYEPVERYTAVQPRKTSPDANTGQGETAASWLNPFSKRGAS